jgi:tight adherence protein B
VVLAGAGWLRTAGRQRRADARGRRATLEACDVMVSELRAGRPLPFALAQAAEQQPALAPAARTAELGGDVVGVLRRLSGLPGHGGLRLVAAAWQVGQGAGSGLAATLARVADGLRADEGLHAEVEAALAPARSTARLLAVLPVFGLALGAGLGGDPVAFLLGGAAGNLLLLGGAVLALAGLVWVEHIARRVRA